MCFKDEGFVSGLGVRVVMQISIQIIVGIWVLVSMMDFMPGKGEHETGIFATCTGQAVRRRGVTLMST